MADEEYEREKTRLRWKLSQIERLEGSSPPKAREPIPETPRDHSFRAALARSIEAGSFVLLHTAVAIVLITCISLVHFALHALDDPKMFGTIPVRWGFDAMDFLVLVTYVIHGVSDARHVFRR